MITRLRVSAAALILAGYPMLAQVLTGTLAGRVVDAAEQAIPSATVTYARVPDTIKDQAGRWAVTPGQTTLAATLTTASGGTFQSSSLPAGRYQICAQTAGFLPSCTWSGTKWVTVGAGATPPLDDIQLLEAARVRIRIQDPLHLLPKIAIPSPVLSVGVMSVSDAYLSAEQTASDADGRTASIDVPFGQPLQIWLYSWKFQISDSKGAALDLKGARIPFQADTSNSLPTFTFVITGTRSL
jgi:hypothetical protein